MKFTIVVGLIFLFTKVYSGDISDAIGMAKGVCSMIVGQVPLCGESTAFYRYKCCPDSIRCCLVLTNLSIGILAAAGGLIALVGLCYVCCCCCCRRRKGDRRPQIIQILPTTNPTVISDGLPPYSRLDD